MKIFTMMCLMLAVFTVTPVMANETNTVTKDITITQDMLLNMDDYARNSLFDSLKKQL